jgi:hypothetical protein
MLILELISVFCFSCSHKHASDCVKAMDGQAQLYTPKAAGATVSLPTMVRLTGLNAGADEEDVMGLIYSKNIPRPKCVNVNRIWQPEGGAQNQTLNEGLAEITSMIPRRELVTEARSFFTCRNLRAGLELFFASDESRDKVLEEWRARRLDGNKKVLQVFLF